MIRHHERIARAAALTLALTAIAASPASATSPPASPGPCSEVCSGGGYGSESEPPGRYAHEHRARVQMSQAPTAMTSRASRPRSCGSSRATTALTGATPASASPAVSRSLVGLAHAAIRRHALLAHAADPVTHGELTQQTAKSTMIPARRPTANPRRATTPRSQLRRGLRVRSAARVPTPVRPIRHGSPVARQAGTTPATGPSTPRPWSGKPQSSQGGEMSSTSPRVRLLRRLGILSVLLLAALALAAHRGGGVGDGVRDGPEQPARAGVRP